MGEGPWNRSIQSRSFSVIIPLFATEKRTIGLQHPSNPKDIHFGEIGAFDGSVMHCGMTLLEKDAYVKDNNGLPSSHGGQESLRRIYNFALHGHVDNMTLEKREENKLSYLDKGKHLGHFEPAEHAMMIDDAPEVRRAHRRKEDEVFRDTSVLLATSRVTQNSDGLFNARVLAQSICCMPVKDMEDGTKEKALKPSKGSKKMVEVLPKIDKGQKTAVVMTKMAIGMMRKTANTDLLVNDTGRNLARECAAAMETILQKHVEEHPDDLVNKQHAQMETDSEDEARTTKTPPRVKARAKDKARANDKTPPRANNNKKRKTPPN